MFLIRSNLCAITMLKSKNNGEISWNIFLIFIYLKRNQIGTNPLEDGQPNFFKPYHMGI
jgi:hypothetical protein